MLDGKILRGLTGTPMRRIALANSALAEAEPEPFTLANLMTKSLKRGWFSDCIACARRARSGRRNGARRLVLAPACRPGMRRFQKEFLHIPGAGRTALCAQTAVQTHIFVLDHDAAGLQRTRG